MTININMRIAIISTGISVSMSATMSMTVK